MSPRLIKHATNPLLTICIWHQVQLRWKDVTAVTKEKTALVIPNAIQICTETDKHFFCSFGARDKTYVILFRTWQQALLDQVATVFLLFPTLLLSFIDWPFLLFCPSRSGWLVDVGFNRSVVTLWLVGWLF